MREIPQSRDVQFSAESCNTECYRCSAHHQWHFLHFLQTRCQNETLLKADLKAFCFCFYANLNYRRLEPFLLFQCNYTRLKMSFITVTVDWALRTIYVSTKRTINLPPCVAIG